MKSLLIALTFLTRIPFPSPSDVTQEEFTRSQNYYPLVGFLLGAILWTALSLLLFLFPPSITAALLLILQLILTGGIHLDGFMDSMDGLLSARSPDRMLEIMKDSRVGAFGAISAIALLLLKFTLFSELLTLKSPSAPLFILFMPMLSRWIFLIGVYFFPYARSNGLGKGFHETSHQTKGIFITQGLFLILLSFWILNWAGLIGFLTSALFILFFTFKSSRLLGGLTGDLYGASIELAEIFFLLGAFPLI
jgi:adenosylcobinamide-GDP ribazoletransferase